MSKKLGEIDLYFRGFIVKKNDNKAQVQDLTIEPLLVKSISNQSHKIYRGLLICNISPVNNINKITFKEKEVEDESKNIVTIKYDFEYPIYFFDFVFNNEGFTFCCVPNILLLNSLFKKDSLTKFQYFKFSLKEICSNFFLYKNTSDIYLSRLNGKLNYETENSIKSISLYGDNILHSSTIRKFLKLRSEPNNNPFKEDTPLFEPKSCRIFCTDYSNGFGLNMDSSGNFSFYLTNIEQFFFLGKIFDSIISSDSFILADKIPIKRSILSLERIEHK